MNQILQVQESRKKNNSNPVDIKKVILFFSVCIIIFGLIFVGQGAYTLYQNKANQKVNLSTPGGNDNAEIPEYIPTITLTKTEDNKVIINVESQIAISHIIYNWNNEASQTLDETGKTNVEEVIDIPIGESVLNISVIDSNGKETKKTTEPYIIEVVKPEIKTPSVIGNDIKIVVTSEVELAYVTYKWNSEEEKKYDMITFEDRTKFETTVRIPTGQNTLKIVAVDINGNQAEKSQEIKGVSKAKIHTPVIRGDRIYFTITAEEDIKTVEFTFNGKKYLMDESTFGQTKEVNYNVQMITGMNYLEITSTTQSDGITTSGPWKREYRPQ